MTASVILVPVFSIGISISIRSLPSPLERGRILAVPEKENPPSETAHSTVASLISSYVKGQSPHHWSSLCWFIFFANVCDHRHRTDGATDAGEERASASGVTAGRCSVDRSVRVLSPSGYGVTLQEKPLREGEVVEIKDAHIEIQSDSGYQLSVKTETHEGGHV